MSRIAQYEFGDTKQFMRKIYFDKSSTKQRCSHMDSFLLRHVLLLLHKQAIYFKQVIDICVHSRLYIHICENLPGNALSISVLQQLSSFLFIILKILLRFLIWNIIGKSNIISQRFRRTITLCIN